MENYLYGRVATELCEIFNYLDISILYKIPQKLIEKLESIKDTEYKFVYDKTKTLNEQDILKETKELFSSIYLQYCCDDKTKKELIEKCNENNKKEEEKYTYENLFKDKQQKEIPREEFLTVVNKKEAFFTRCVNNIKSFFYKIIGKK